MTTVQDAVKEIGNTLKGYGKRIRILETAENSSAGDPDAIHDNVASEISAITEKVAPIGADLLLLEDSENSNNKKRVQITNLPVAWTLIAPAATPDDVATVTFTSIPATYKHLAIVIAGRSLASGTFIDTWAQFNNDTGSNYRYQYLWGRHTTASAGSAATSAGVHVGLTADSGTPANTFSGTTMWIYNYANTSIFKRTLSTGGMYDGAASSSNGVWTEHGTWASVAAISEIDLYLGSGNWAVGSTLHLFGVS